MAANTDVFDSGDFQRLQSGIDDYIRDQYGEDGVDAIEALMQAGDELSGTAEVELTPQLTVTVKDELSGATERSLHSVFQQDDLDAVVTEIINIITQIIVEPEAYTDPKAWEPLYEKHGATFLLEVIDAIREPADERAGAIESFR